jgi:hypothetical protein
VLTKREGFNGLGKNLVPKSEKVNSSNGWKIREIVRKLYNAKHDQISVNMFCSSSSAPDGIHRLDWNNYLRTYYVEIRGKKKNQFCFKIVQDDTESPPGVKLIATKAMSVGFENLVKIIALLDMPIGFEIPYLTTVFLGYAGDSLASMVTDVGDPPPE